MQAAPIKLTSAIGQQKRVALNLVKSIKTMS